MQFAILKGVYGTRRKMQESQCMSVREQVYKVLLDSRMNRPALESFQFATKSIYAILK